MLVLRHEMKASDSYSREPSFEAIQLVFESQDAFLTLMELNYWPFNVDESLLAPIPSRVFFVGDSYRNKLLDSNFRYSERLV